MIELRERLMRTASAYMAGLATSVLIDRVVTGEVWAGTYLMALCIPVLIFRSARKIENAPTSTEIEGDRR